MPSLSPGSRWVPLDLLRAFAILLVLYGHVNFRMPDNTAGYRLFYILRQMGLIGVDLFLVLSGFFTALLLFSEHRANRGEISYRGFFLRRAWKIWPSYFLAVLMVLGWQWLRIHKGGVAERTSATFSDTWQYFAHVQNYSEPRADYIQQTWTMVLIVHFYLAFPLILMALQKMGDGKYGKPFRAIPWLFLAIAAMSFFLRYRAAYAVGKDGKIIDYDAWLHYFPTQLRVDEIMAGVVLAYFAVYCREATHRISRFWPVILLLSIGCMLPVALRIEESPRFLYIWGYSLAGLGCAGLTWLAWNASRLAARTPTRWTTWLPVRALAFLGLSSYSIYIWHQPFAQVMGTRIGNKVCDLLHLWGSRVQYPALVAIYLAVAIGSGVLMYFLVERPALRFRDRLLRPGVRPMGQELDRGSRVDRPRVTSSTVG